MVIYLIGWSVDERQVLLRVNGVKRWVDVERPDDGRAYCTVDGYRWRIDSRGLAVA